MNAMNAKIRLLLAAVFALWLGVSLSCQSSSGPSADQQGPQSLVLEISFDSDAKAPDSGRWSIRKDSGDVSVELVGERKYSTTFEIPSPIGSDKLWLTMWTAGLRLVQVPYVWRDGAVVRDDQGVVYDSATLAVVRAIQKLVGTDSQVAMSKGGAATLFARAILANDSLARFVSNRLPGGLDSQRVFDSVVALAARSGRSFKQILTTWTLGKDSAWLQVHVAELVASGVLLKTDSTKFFPPPPVRLKTPLAVVADLVAGGAEQSVSGEFAWDSGAVTVEANIWRGSDSVTERFQVFLVAAPGAKDTTWNLSKLIVKAREGIDTGSYELQVVVSDPKGNSAKGQSRLHVVAAPPGAPRLVRRLPEHQEDNVLPFDSAELRMEWVVRNPANFDDTTFRVDGTVPLKRNDSVWTASVAIAPDGREKTIAIRARSKSGEAISDYVKVVRLRDSAGPTIVWISPTSEVVVDFAVESFLVKLRATDPSGIDSVWIDGVAASLQDGSWQATVRLDPTGGVREIRATARDMAGNRSDSTIRIGRGRDNIRPTVVPRTASGVWPHDSVFATLSWTVTDNHQVGVVKIGDSLANRSGDAYALRVPLKMGTNRFVLVASDTSGNVRSDTVVLVRAAGVPVHTLPERRYIGRVWDTVTSVDADSLEWSVDGKSWKKVAGPIPVDQSGTYQVRAWPGPSERSRSYIVTKAKPVLRHSSNEFFAMIGDTLFRFNNTAAGRYEGGTCYAVPNVFSSSVKSVGTMSYYDWFDFLDLAGRRKRYLYPNEYVAVSDTIIDFGVAPNGSPVAQISRSGGNRFVGMDGFAWMGQRKVLEGAKKIEWQSVLGRDGVLWEINLSDDSTQVVAVPIESDVIDVESNDYVVFALKRDGTLKAKAIWNGWGQLGLGDYDPRDSLVVVRTGVVGISVGLGITAILRADGTLETAGDNLFGQLGHGTKTPTESSLRKAAGDVEDVTVGGGFGQGIPLGMLSYVTTDGALYLVGYSEGAEKMGCGNSRTPILTPMRIHF